MSRAPRQVRIGRKLAVGVIPGALAVWAATTTTADAQTLEQALSLAYATNPEIAAERAQLDATGEGVAQARARGLPQITAGAGHQRVDNTQSINGDVFGVGAGARDFKLDLHPAGRRFEPVTAHH